MKKLVLSLFLMSSILIVNAQNFQFLKGINPDKSNVNFATFELYKPLDHGALYFFTDFKMSKEGFVESYSEISKYWNVGKIGAVTLQYNAGLNKDFQIQPVYLAGVSKLFEFGDAPFVLSFDILYRHQKELILENEKANGYQITMIFLQDMKRIQLSGYCDYWSGNYYIFEPQGWFKLFERVWIGLEWRASNYNLLEDYENYMMFGVKWNLE